ncbi:MAG: DNA repair protein RadC [bacterium]
MPREKLDRYGISGMTDLDLIAIILGSGNRKYDYMMLAKKVFNVISIEEKMRSPIRKRLLSISGIGRVKAMQIECCLELGKRLYSTDNSVVIRCRDDVERIVNYLKNKKQEYAVVLYLDARNRLLKRKTLAIGSANMLVVEPREVFEYALKYHAVSIILVHNHPSGDNRASRADKEFTQRVVKAGKILGIQVLDHVVI